MTILGIDLGTTNSACAIWRDGQAELIPNRLGEYLTPSVVSVDAKEIIIVGRPARQHLITYPDRTVSVFKRAMGSEHLFTLGKKMYSALELSSLVLRSLKEDTEHYLEEEVHKAVISVPAYFNDVQRKATKLAGELAGLQVERLINEPTAAAMVYGLHNRNGTSRFLVLDLGGGTFDVTLVEHFEGVIEVHASCGDNYLGGEDFIKPLAERFCEDQGIRLKELDGQQCNRLFDAMEQVKCQLSSEHQVEIHSVLPQQSAPWSIDREKFEELSKPLLRRLQRPIEQTFHDSGLSLDEIDELILVGGATRMSLFHSMIARMFRRLPTRSIEPDLVVAMGAAVQAGLRERHSDLDDIVLTDVCPFTLGVAIINEADKFNKEGDLYLPIIERNTIVPTSIVRTLCTTEDKQKELRVSIYQGESRLVKNNIHLGDMEVKVPTAPAGQETIDVRYSYDMNGLLEVDVTVNSTGQVHSKSIINAPSSLSGKEIQAASARLAKLKFHPRESEKNRLLIARAERLFETSLGEQREFISHILSQFEQVLDRQNAKEIEQAAVQLEQKLDEIEQSNAPL